MNKTESKRTFKISLLTGISVNTAGNASEFTLHIGSEYDYRFVYKKRDIVVEILRARYAEKMNKNLPIFDIPEKNLKGFTTTEKDKMRGVDRNPPDNFRNTTGDLLKEETKIEQTPQAKDVDFGQIDNYGQGKQAARDDKQENVEENDPDAMDEVAHSVAELPA